MPLSHPEQMILNKQQAQHSAPFFKNGLIKLCFTGRAWSGAGALEMSLIRPTCFVVFLTIQEVTLTVKKLRGYKIT